ncbi:MAG: Lipid-A-disaccharide synthase [Chlamydiia bacterium]|nr:Lipid-A-disaccharide synthase [Chlamydiia bacterium]MCH9615100.1 Lipid-A-disaccharide synthase [Chlamydiia bacterium]MCH9628578.1 Lipid-A-disaccharide synthase [Chlamydiia bacterium]
MCDLFVFAGEMSGDLHGHDLIESMPHLSVSAVAGPKMRELENVECVIEMEKFQVMGFTDILSALPRLYRLYRQVKASILKKNPPVVVLIDYAEFNLHLAKGLRKAGFEGKIIQYICPTVWAWRKNRIPTMEKNLDGLLTLFPFEPKYFKKLDAKFVGHPLSKKRRLTPPNGHFLSIFPGSRTTEIKRNLPMQYRVAKKTGMEIAVSCAHKKFESLIKELAPGAVIYHDREFLIEQTKCALATSGTICLELALNLIPTVCNFAIKPLDLFIATKIFKINLSHYCIVNIIAGKTLFPEYYGPNMTEALLLDGLKRLPKPEDLLQIGDALSSPEESANTAILYNFAEIE